MSEREIRQLTSLLLGSLEVVEAAELDMDVEESLGDLRHVLKDLQDVSMRIAINEEPIATDRAISGGAWAWAWGFAIGQPEPLLGASPDEVIGWWLWTTHAFAPPPSVVMASSAQAVGDGLKHATARVHHPYQNPGRA